MGPHNKSAPQATSYRAPKVKTCRGMKSPFNSWLTAQETSLDFFYAENVWLYRWFPNQRMPKGPECEIAALRECLSRGSALLPIPLFIHNCFPGPALESAWSCYVWQEQNAPEISWNPRLCPNCGITKPLFSPLSRNGALVFILTGHSNNCNLQLMLHEVCVVA